MITKHITSTKRNVKYQGNKTYDTITVILLYDIDPYRMKSYGPLPLICLAGGKKLIDEQILTIKKYFDNPEILISVNGNSDRIYKYVKQYHKNLNIRIVENQISSESNSCENIRLCLNNTMNSKILICSGGLLLNDSMKLIDINNTSILIESNPCENLDIGVNVNENNEAQHFCFGAKKVWSEILFLHNQENIDSLKKIIISKNVNKNKFLFEILNDLLVDCKINCVINKNKLIKISNIKTYHQIKEKV
jgi:hypothetical protein